VCVSQREWLFSVKEQNVDDLGVFDVKMIDWIIAICTRCVSEFVCVGERVCVSMRVCVCESKSVVV